MDYSSFYLQKIYTLNNIISNLNKQITQLNLQLQTERLINQSRSYSKGAFNESFSQTPTIYLKESGSQTEIFINIGDNHIITEPIPVIIPPTSEPIPDIIEHILEPDSKSIDSTTGSSQKSDTEYTEITIESKIHTRKTNKKNNMNRGLYKVNK